MTVSLLVEQYTFFSWQKMGKTRPFNSYKLLNLKLSTRIRINKDAIPHIFMFNALKHFLAFVSRCILLLEFIITKHKQREQIYTTSERSVQVCNFLQGKKPRPTITEKLEIYGPFNLQIYPPKIKGFTSRPESTNHPL